MKEIRKDYILDRYVVISPKRKKRPNSHRIDRDYKNVKCPFCPGNENLVPEIIKEVPEGNWQFRLLPNKFPALEEDNLKMVEDSDLFSEYNSFGSHEILVETPEHDKKFYQIGRDKLETYLNILAERYRHLVDMEDISYVSIFKNRGPGAGESIGHSHSQIVSSPVVPEHISTILDCSEKYFTENKSCPYCDILREELNRQERIILETDKFVVLSPFAPTQPYESWILPKRHVSEMDEINNDEKKNLAKILKKLLSKYNDLFGNFSYNLLFYSFPLEKYSHFHVIIRPKLKNFGGSEEFGLYINEISPEKASSDLRIDI
ncbi:MAG: galactose-1-phosphate uridylyltransferase [Candidatus Aenigmatarchaeota archaeon]